MANIKLQRIASGFWTVDAFQCQVT